MHIMELKRKYDEFADLTIEQLDKINELIEDARNEPTDEEEGTIADLECEISSLEAKVSELEYNNDWLYKQHKELEEENEKLKQEIANLKGE